MPFLATSDLVGTEKDGYIDLMGRRFYRIAEYDRIPPFFMTVVGAGDPWLFISSSGGLTAGRVRSDRALFPYYTDDKITESAGRTGGLSLLRVAAPDSEMVLWEPFAAIRHLGTTRNLYKDTLGTTLVFEESLLSFGLRFRVAWQTSSRFGIVRSVELTNLGTQPCTVELIDGFVNLLPAGVDVITQTTRSNLLDAYKRNELDSPTGLGIFSLSSRLTDLAEPSESLQASVAWQVGLASVHHLLCVEQVPVFRAGGVVEAETDVRAARGAYLAHADLTLARGEGATWRTVGDVMQDGADVVAIHDLLTRPEEAADLLAADIQSTQEGLERLVAGSDGRQSTGEELATAHHAANVLFNIMRGGIPVDGYQIELADFRNFVAQRSPATLAALDVALTGKPEVLPITELTETARDSADPDFIRMSLEYLPLTFSRRHGDPSRPWNQFEILLQDEHGHPRLSFEGNWRDIFQNWEALALSYPEYLESMISVFVNATTADGYNPYRISRAGIDWEVPDPDDPWSNIGYWSDHQIIYLLRLLQASHDFHPGRLEQMRDSAIFTHADVPYRIAAYDQIVADPYDTITFDEERESLINGRIAEQGADGRLVHDRDGELVRTTLAEKLLLLLVAKLGNLVPDGGVWMNTQRPEWNDANNALVGLGLSVVTLAQMRPYIVFLQELLVADAEVSLEFAELFSRVAKTMEAHRSDLEQGFDDTTRLSLMGDMGAAGSDYRASVYSGSSGLKTAITSADIQALLTTARSYVEATLRTNLRDDHLYHSYNIIELGPEAVGIRRLSEMLEGQVAVLGSGMLNAEESLDLMTSLRRSKLYRADQHSYMLYPDKELPRFFDRTQIPGELAEQAPLLRELVAADDRSVVVADLHGGLHFSAGVRNARDVNVALDLLSDRPDLAEKVGAGRQQLTDVFEKTFRHAEFTGRSGTFFAYEGLGSIYWHMVSKLLLAVQETLHRAIDEGASVETLKALSEAYEDVRTGIGYCKPAATYGAFPVDPYSHTPAGHGARQPGMTGQVKEEVLTRLGELGLRVEAGEIHFEPVQLRSTEWLSEATTFQFLDVEGEPQTLELPPGSMAFTFCQVPVIYHRSDSLQVTAHLKNGEAAKSANGLGRQLSEEVFQRLGTVELIEVSTATAGLSE
ncbi:MAG: hypothetical protein ACOYEV_15885 [Candidatus Nanopelagicales bacterium]